jgi:hypothetical protein
MHDIKLLETCTHCGDNLMLTESVRGDNHNDVYAVKRCLSCGSFPVEEILKIDVYPTDRDLAKLAKSLSEDQKMVDNTVDQLKAIKAENIPSILKRLKAGMALCKHLEWMGQNEIVDAFYVVEKEEDINHWRGCKRR